MCKMSKPNSRFIGFMLIFSLFFLSFTDMVSEKYNGYAVAREFYAPRYDKPEPEHDFPDFRTTLHWQPSVKTDAMGKATVSFFASDARSPIDMVLEGVAKTGQIGATRIRFEVK
jgi:hypothetical protein